MDEDTSFDYDEFSLDFNDPLLDSQLDSFTNSIPSNSRKVIPSKTPVGLKPPPSKQQQQQQQSISKPIQIQSLASKRNLNQVPIPIPITRHSQAILRPPQPPTKRTQTINNNSTSNISNTLNYKKLIINPIVHPNPFQHKVISTPKRIEITDDSMDVSGIDESQTAGGQEEGGEEEEEEEEMPMIDIGASGFIRSDASGSKSLPISISNQGGRKIIPLSISAGTSSAMAMTAMLPPPLPLARGAGGKIGTTFTTSTSMGKGKEVNQNQNQNYGDDDAVSGGIIGGGTKGLTSAERRELDSLRAEKIMLQKSLEISKTSLEQKHRELTARGGEVSIVRSNLQKSEKLLTDHIEAASKIKRVLEEKLEEKEREFKRELDANKVQNAFKRQELETSASRRPSISSSSQWSSSQRPRSNSLLPPNANSTQFNSTSKGPPPLPSMYGNGSPSLGRSKNLNLGTGGGGGMIGTSGGSIKKPIFPGFVNAFEPSSSSQSQSQLIGNGRSESMGPPPIPILKYKEVDTNGNKNINGTPKKKKAVMITTPVKDTSRNGTNSPIGSRSVGNDKGKGKGKMLVDLSMGEEEEEGEEEETRDEDDSMMIDHQFQNDSRIQGGDEDIEMEIEGGEDEEEEEEMELESRLIIENDWKGEILSALFSHTTFIQYDSESVTTFPSSSSSSLLSTQRSTATNSFRSTGFQNSNTFRNSTSTSTSNPQIGDTSNTQATQTPIDTSPVPTFHYLTNFRFPTGTLGSIIGNYEDTCREFFSFLGRRRSPLASSHSHLHYHQHGDHQDDRLRREELEYEEKILFFRELGNYLENLLKLLESAGTIGPIIPLLSLIAYLILIFPEFNLYFLNDPTTSNLTSNSTSTTTTTTTSSSTRIVIQESKFLFLLARLIRRFGKPTLPIPIRLPDDPNNTSTSTSNSSSLLALSGTGGRGKARERSRRQRGVLEKKLEGGGGGLGGGKRDGDEKVEVESVRRDAMLRGCLEVLEGLAWRIPEGVEAIFVDFLATKDNVATLLDPLQPNDILASTLGVLTLLSTRPNLFRALVGIPFSEGSDIRSNSTDCSLFNRIGTLTGRKKIPFNQSFELDMSLITFVTSLLSKHDDSILLLTGGSTSLLPELLTKLYQDVRVLWQYDGQDITEDSLLKLKSIVKRLSALVHFFYYLIGAPTSTFSIAEFLATNKATLGLPDRYNVAFGTLSYAPLPDWAEALLEGGVLISLSYLAQDIMEDVSPREAEEIESCFTTLSGGEEDGTGEGEGDDRDMMSGDEEEKVFRQGLSQS